MNNNKINAGDDNVQTMYNFPFRGVIFDMDGTLIETTQADYHAWKKVFEDHGQELSFDDYFPLIGMKSEVVVNTRLHLEGEEAKKALLKKADYFRDIIESHGIQTVPYATRLLKKLKQHNLKLALATSSRSQKMNYVLKLTELLQYFDVIVTGDEVTRSKPAPDVFIKAVEKLNLPVSQCVVIEDAASGVKAAKNAGLKCIAITTTHSADLLHEADLVISSFEELDLDKLSTLANT